MSNNIATKLQAILSAKGDIKDAIEGKGVTVGSASLDQYASKIEQIPAPVVEAPENDVNFYDYDGFRVASYTIAEAKALTALPTPPTHEGLTFQEWNWTLNDIKTYDRQYADIGANYITSDGKTHLYVNIQAGETFTLSFVKGGGVAYEISWGDNSPSETSSSGNTASFTHTYANAGKYDVTISPSQEDIEGFRITSSLVNVIEILTGKGFWIPPSDCLGKISVHKDSVSSSSSLSNNYLHDLNYIFIVLPKGQYSTANTNFKYNCFGAVIFPKSVGRIAGTRWLYTCYSITRLVVPNTDNNDALNSDSVANMRYLRLLSIPNVSVSSNNVFANCPFLEYIDVVQGWVPSISITLSGSTKWNNANMVRFFNKLGTTTNAITLTFGSTNLNKLTAEEKAIATNKGYTLA